MPNWFPLHLHTTYSLLDGLSQPPKVAERLLECGYEGSAVTDHGGISGVPAFVKALQKKNLKAIAGCEFYVAKRDATDKVPDNTTSHLCVLANGQDGWKNLMRASSASYMPDVRYRKPRLDLERLASFSKGTFICFSGHMGSELADVCFNEPKLAYNARTYEEAKALVRPDWKSAVRGCIEKFITLFGRDNFYVEIQLVDQKNLPASIVVARILRYVAKELGVPCVATADSHYPRRQDAPDQRILLCSSFNTTMKQVQRAIDNDEDVTLASFFRSNNYHIPSLEEMVELHSDHPDELENAVLIAKRCSSPDMGGKPMMPTFPCPRGLTPDQYLLELCQDGWKRKVAKKVKVDQHPVYQARLEHELSVLNGAGLASYFLIKHDIIQHATKVLKSKTGKGRGSAAGCLVSYLTDITKVDPILAGLIFERFYNAGRNTPGRIAFPDIDSDFQISVRDQVVQYIRDKYGSDKVAQIATFSRMQGRGALKDVFRAHEAVSFEEMNKITEHIPDESEIVDQLQEMREETGEASILMWSLLHNPEPLKQWVFLNEQGEVDGPLGIYFAQAIRLEGTRRSMGKHASGVIVSSQPLADMVPMCWDKGSGEMMVAVDMREAESVFGLLKLDILGLRTLDCLRGVEKIVRTGRLR